MDIQSEWGVSRSLSEHKSANEVWGQICNSFFVSFFMKEKLVISIGS